MINQAKKILKNIKRFTKLKPFEKEQEGENLDEYCPSQIETWIFYLKFLKIDWKIFLITNIKVLVTSIISARSIFVILNIKNSLVNQDYENLTFLITEYTVSKLLLRLIDMLESSMNSNTYQDTFYSIQKQILEQLFSLDIQFFDNNKVSQLYQIISNGSFQIAIEILNIQLIADISLYIQHFGQLYFIYTQSAIILIVMFLISIASTLIQQYFEQKKKENEKESSELNEFKKFAINDILNNIQLIKSYCTEQKEIQSLNEIVKQNAIYLKNKSYYQQILSIISNSTTQILSIVPIFYILLLQLNIQSGKRDIAIGLLEIIVHSYSSFFIINNLFKFLKQKPNNQYEEEKKQIGKVMLLFREKPLVPQNIEKNDNFEHQTQLLEGNIVFENVYFRYPISNDNISKMIKKQQKDKHGILENEGLLNSLQNEIDDNQGINLQQQKELQNQQVFERDYVLKNLSFKIIKGQLVSFVGMSGSGKSTIVKLIERFYDVNQGVIMIDEQNIKDVCINKLRKSIGIVSQETLLFDNDIEYNITYGCQNYQYTQEDLKQICDISGVSEFVADKNRFPLGLNTLVGSKGIKLSGGQKQRIAIARALMKKPQILILDEATSSLDGENEYIVQKQIDELVEKRGMTIIIVAHRLSTIINSDVIFVLDKGEIKEFGKHPELINQNGIYKKLFINQIEFQNQIHTQINLYYLLCNQLIQKQIFTDNALTQIYKLQSNLKFKNLCFQKIQFKL